MRPSRWEPSLQAIINEAYSCPSKRPGTLSVCEKSIHPLQKARIEDVRLVHNEIDLFALTPCSAKYRVKILIEIITRILVRRLDPEHP